MYLNRFIFLIDSQQQITGEHIVEHISLLFSKIWFFGVVSDKQASFCFFLDSSTQFARLVLGRFMQIYLIYHFSILMTSRKFYRFLINAHLTHQSNEGMSGYVRVNQLVKFFANCCFLFTTLFRIGDFFIKSSILTYNFNTSVYFACVAAICIVFVITTGHYFQVLKSCFFIFFQDRFCYWEKIDNCLFPSFLNEDFYSVFVYNLIIPRKKFWHI